MSKLILWKTKGLRKRNKFSNDYLTYTVIKRGATIVIGILIKYRLVVMHETYPTCASVVTQRL
jgi:hypothetical protein